MSPGCRRRARSRAGSRCCWCWQRKTCCCSTACRGGRTPGRTPPPPTPCWPHGSCTRHSRTTRSASWKVFLRNAAHLSYFFMKWNMIHCAITDFYSKCRRFVITRTVLWFWLFRRGLPLTLKWDTLELIVDHHYENVPISESFCTCISWCFFFSFCGSQKKYNRKLAPPTHNEEMWYPAVKRSIISSVVVAAGKTELCLMVKRDGAAWRHWEWLTVTLFLICHCTAGIPSFLRISVF